MAAPRNFVTGFNHNIKHQGQVFHVQTEDSGEEIAQIATHLFVGGTILASKRASYAELRGGENLRERVKSLMERQHKDVLRSLVNGEYDALARGIRAYQPGEIDAGPGGATPPAALLPERREPVRPRHSAVPPMPPPVVEAAAPLSVDIDISIDELPIIELSAEDLAADAPLSEAQPPVADEPPVRERLHVPLRDPAPIRPATPGPSPWASRQPQPWGRGARPATPGPESPRRRPEPLAHAATEKPSEGFFGEDLISEKSLDQVILAYLAGEGVDEK